MLNNGKEFYINLSNFDYKSEPIEIKELFFIMLLPMFSTYLLILTVIRPWANFSVMNLFMSFFFPLLMTLVILIAIYIPFNPKPDFDIYFWRLTKNQGQHITLTINKKNSQNLSFSFNDITITPFNYFTSRINDLKKYNGIRKYLSKNKEIAILKCNNDLINTEQDIYLFEDSSAENIQLIYTCINNWINIKP